MPQEPGLGTTEIAVAGGLTLALSSATLRVDPDPGYEAWELRGPGTEMVVCMPGGELAIWS